jgi:hypothetical protein
MVTKADNASLGLLLSGCILAGCVEAPEGANWALADFNKYERNYEAFDLGAISVGEEFSSVSKEIGGDFRVVEATQSYQIAAFQRWVAVAGPDYVEETLYVKVMQNGTIGAWKVTKDTVSVVPLSW